MPELAVVARPLPALADEINREHCLCEASYQGALEHAYEAGRLLREVKASLPHGEWLPWVAANVTVTDRQASKYMRLAENWTEIESSNQNRGSDLTDLSIRAALKLIPSQPREPDDEPEPADTPMPEWGHETRVKAQRAYQLLYEAAASLDGAQEQPDRLRAAATFARRATAILDELVEAA